MKTRSLLIGMLLVVLAGCGIGYRTPRHHNASGAPTKRVLFFGDSIMVATAPAIAARMTAKGMSAFFRYGADNAGTPVQRNWVGTSHTPREELQSLLDSSDPDIVIANFAGHEFAGWNAWDHAVDAMSETIRNSSATVYWTIPPYIGNRYVDGDQWSRAVWYEGAGPYKSTFAYELVYPEDDTGRRVRLTDQIHPTAAGKDRIARWTTWTLRGEWGIP